MAYDTLRAVLGKRHLQEEEQDRLEESPLYQKLVELRGAQTDRMVNESELLNVQTDTARHGLSELIRATEEDKINKELVHNVSEKLKTYQQYEGEYKDIPKDVKDSEIYEEIIKQTGPKQAKLVYNMRNIISPEEKRALQKVDPGFYRVLFPEGLKSPGERIAEINKEIAQGKAWSSYQLQLLKGAQNLERDLSNDTREVAIRKFQAQLDRWVNEENKGNLTQDQKLELLINFDTIKDALVDLHGGTGFFGVGGTDEAREIQKQLEEASKSGNLKVYADIIKKIEQEKPITEMPEGPEFTKGKETGEDVLDPSTGKSVGKWEISGNSVMFKNKMITINGTAINSKDWTELTDTEKYNLLVKLDLIK
jgi:hypothetical protein